jgi:ElaB/YqjD/DUF883 family membrane-anchored ribosome-binding protein
MDPVDQASSLLRDRTSAARERIGDAVQTTREKLETNVQAHPVRTLLLSVGAGLLVGLILGLGRRRRSED